MRKPKDIKAGLKTCATNGECKKCPYDYDCKMYDGFCSLANDALQYIDMLELMLTKKMWNKICELNGREET